TPNTDTGSTAEAEQETPHTEQHEVAEVNGPKGPEPTRYGDWERKGRCVDF
ncbi:succinate dehydrogenase assembly factor 4, partial [Methylomonas sp.]|uniref:DUF1674 domain-containing protein n=1 Tax=Methylomonas sp. TaxID=418 RepID=UPI0025D11ECA